MASTHGWIVTGSRDARPMDRIDEMLDQEVELYGLPDFVVHGTEQGADLFVGQWAKKCGITAYEFPVNVNRWGEGARHQRNLEMLDAYPDARVFAFPLLESTGTRHMITSARRRGHFVKVRSLDV